MTPPRSCAQLSVLALAITGMCGCGRPLLERPRPASETWSATIAPDHFKTIATIAGTDARADMRVTVRVRDQLTAGGWNAVRRAGRWDSEMEAIIAICAPGAEPVDGVLVVSYSRLKLYECGSNVSAYQIESDPTRGGVGIIEMTNRLMQYLHGDKKPPP